uniref:PPPDE domain-containing protein n=1 Tax=Helicotheca tamesis TaxID=374047 RepID=A0A7S2IF48_9STRA|mmetsp:Transcript_8772/g.12145  ORF Transcript_8772/g.12145 Transcript_8772/m.12145 type:complete len:211 (+) Transcript_8772:356-988(+)
MTPLWANGNPAKSLPLQARLSSSNKEKAHSVYREVETFMDGHSVIVALSREYMGTDYDLLRKNCCTFALEALVRLGVPKEEIPTWFYNIAEAGAATEDTVKDVDENVLSPLRRMMSGSLVDDDEGSIGEEKAQDQEHGPDHHGFEVIAKIKRGSLHKTEMEIVSVVESIVENRKSCSGNPPFSPKHISNPEDAEHKYDSIGIRHTLSWTY